MPGMYFPQAGRQSLYTTGLRVVESNALIR